jgi:hypothetical protein
MSFWKSIRSGITALALDCREAARAQSEMLDHPLPTARRLGLRLHVFICKWCRRYGKQIRFLREAARDHAEDLVEANPQKLSDEARERIKRRLREKQ